jgi:hypothetical protein
MLCYAQSGIAGKPYTTTHSQPEIFVLGFYAAYVGSQLPTFRDNL